MFVLEGVTLPSPQGFDESFVVIGEMSRTMLGSARRAIRARKRVWTLRWDLLTQTEYESIKAIYELNRQVSFSVASLSTPIDTQVLVDINGHAYTAGTGQNFISGIELVLTEA